MLRRPLTLITLSEDDIEWMADAMDARMDPDGKKENVREGSAEPSDAKNTPSTSGSRALNKSRRQFDKTRTPISSAHTPNSMTDFNAMTPANAEPPMYAAPQNLRVTRAQARQRVNAYMNGAATPEMEEGSPVSDEDEGSEASSSSNSPNAHLFGTPPGEQEDNSFDRPSSNTRRNQRQ